MKTIQYEQTWAVEDYILDMDHTVEQVWEQQEQIAWLIEQGYEPRIEQKLNVNRQAVTFCMTFLVREQDLTFLMLKWPEARTTHDFS